MTYIFRYPSTRPRFALIDTAEGGGRNAARKTVLEAYHQWLIDSRAYPEKCISDLCDLLRVNSSEAELKMADVLSTPISEIGFSIRSLKSFNREKIATLGELVQKSEEELLRIENFGAKSLAEVKAVLAEDGLRLRDAY